MARPRVRRKTKNPSTVVSRRQRHRLNISFAGAHPLIQKSWDKTKTLRQNYEAMGLVVSLQGAAGGTGGEAAAIVQEMARVDTLKKDIEWRVLDNPSEEKGTVVDDVQENENGGSAIITATVSKKLGKKAKAVKTATAAMDELPQLIDFAPIEQPIRVDPRTKRIGTKLGVKLVVTPAAALGVNPIIAAMEEESRNAVKLLRHTSTHEDIVYKDLITKHGNDYDAMSKDLRLNVYQLTAGQLKRKINTFQLIKHE